MTLIERDEATLALSKLLDQTGEASEWNEAIETAINTIENLE